MGDTIYCKALRGVDSQDSILVGVLTWWPEGVLKGTSLTYTDFSQISMVCFLIIHRIENKNTEPLNNTVNQPDLIDFCRTFYPTTAE